MKKMLVLGAVIGAALVALFFAFNSYIYSEKQGTGEPREPYEATLSGTRECLPKKGPGPHTEECVFGMRTEVGEYYVLDTNIIGALPAYIENGERFTARGTVTPIERLSTDRWMSFDVEGVFSIATIEGVSNVTEPQPSLRKCYVGGCSSQLCTDTPDMVSTCEYREAYACFQGAACERQASGECGWTQTAELDACLANAD